MKAKKQSAESKLHAGVFFNAKKVANEQKTKKKRRKEREKLV